MISMFEMRTIMPVRQGQEAGGRPLRAAVVCNSKIRPPSCTACSPSSTRRRRSSTPPARRARRATSRSTPTRRFRSTSSTRRCGCRARSCRGSCSAAGWPALLAGFGLQYWASAIEYPMNVGGRPYASWPAFVVPAYETTILFASITAVVGDDRAERAAAAVPPAVQRARRFRAPRRIASSCASKRPIRSSRLAPRAQFLQGLKPVGVSDVAD